jgi:hypothetical protein
MVGENDGAIGLEIGDVAGEERDDGIGEENADEAGDGFTSWLKLFSAPEKSIIANKLTMIAPTMIALFTEVLRFCVFTREAGG